MKTLGRLVGNAVPVKLGEAIGRSLRLHVQEFMLRERKKSLPKSATAR